MAQAVFSAIISLVVAGGTSIAGSVQRDRFRQEFRTEFMAEQALVGLLEHPQWEQRSFREIRRRIGGFDDDEIRRLLVRAGAVRFGEGESEHWGLRRRNMDRLV